VMDEDTCMVDMARRIMHFYAHESCGWCIPCREGTSWLRKMLDRFHAGYGRPEDIDLVGDLAKNMLGRTFCPLGDAAALPFTDGAFDLVVCRAALHHFPDPAVQIAEMARVCRPGGRVVVSDMLAPGTADRAAFDALHRVIDPSHARCLLDAEMSGLITTHVGAITGRTEPGITYTLPVGAFLTDAGQPDAAMAALQAELAGGPRTGFRPANTGTGTGITVTFDRAIMASSRER